MNRLEYLTQLRRLLEDGGLAEDEINDAMGFYEEIFLDDMTLDELREALQVEIYIVKSNGADLVNGAIGGNS